MRCDSLRGSVISSEFAKKKREEMKKQMSKKALELQEQMLVVLSIEIHCRRSAVSVRRRRNSRRIRSGFV